MPYRIILSLWESVKDSPAYHVVVMGSIVVMAWAGGAAWSELRASDQAIEAKIEAEFRHIQNEYVRRSDLQQIEKRLESIQADVREIRNSQSR